AHHEGRAYGGEHEEHQVLPLGHVVAPQVALAHQVDQEQAAVQHRPQEDAEAVGGEHAPQHRCPPEVGAPEQGRQGHHYDGGGQVAEEDLALGLGPQVQGQEDDGANGQHQLGHDAGQLLHYRCRKLCHGSYLLLRGLGPGQQGYQFSQPDVEEPEHDHGVYAQQDGEGRQGQQGDLLVPLQVRQLGVFRGRGAHKHPPQGHQVEGRRQDQADQGGVDQVAPDGEGPYQGKELRNEPGQARQPQVGEGREGQEAAGGGHGPEEAPQPVQIPGSRTLVVNPHQDEQHGGDDAVGDHAEHGSNEAFLGAG